MADISLRAYENPPGAVEDLTVLHEWWAYDGNQIRGALELGTLNFAVRPNVDVVSNRPAADVSNRGRIWIVDGGAGVGDKVQICLKKSDDSYAWFDLIGAS